MTRSKDRPGHKTNENPSKANHTQQSQNLTELMQGSHSSTHTMALHAVQVDANARDPSGSYHAPMLHNWIDEPQANETNKEKKRQAL